MIARTVKPCSNQELAFIRRWLQRNPECIWLQQPPALKHLQADGCLLLAHGSPKAARPPLGLVGLDPARGCISLLAVRRTAALQSLLDAAERLAVSFGLQSISLEAGSLGKHRSRMPDSWRPKHPAGPLWRSLSRRQTALARRVSQLNKELGVPENYGGAHRLRLQPEPAQLAAIGTDVFDREQFMLPRAAAALRNMLDLAGQAGIVIQPVSAFRTVDYQFRLLQNKLGKGQLMADILRVSAAPGYSEHHSGRAVDLTTPGFKPLEEEFERSAAFAWLDRHAREFEFRLSYPAGNRQGVAYEPWHWYWFGR